MIKKLLFITIYLLMICILFVIYKSDGAEVSFINSTENGWGYQSMNFPQSNNQYSKSKEVKIAILDTGIETTNNELSHYICNSYNALDEAKQPIDLNGHGTHIGGIITKNSPKNIKILPIKIIENHGRGDLDIFLKGMNYAIKQKVDIINISLNSDKDIPEVHKVIKRAYEQGVVIVASSGNNEKNSISYPAKYKEVISVGAINQKEERVHFSQYGDGLDFVAPGYEIKSNYINGETKVINGTSQAAAYITKAIALSYLEGASRTPKNALSLLKQASVDLEKPGYDNITGYGKVDVMQLLELSRKQIQR